MYLKKIIIKNFMMHEHFEQSFGPDINVITGLTETGKSCMFKAMTFLFNQCSLSQDDYRREGTKETSVEGILSNGFSVERIRTNSINRYILKKEDCEDQVFDSFGKELPEEIADALEISQINVDKEHVCLNFGDQDDMNFLIDNTYSDGFKAKLFNKLTGNEILDKVFKELNKEALSVSRDIKTSEKLNETQEEQMAEYSLSYKSLKSKLSMATEQFESIDKDNQECELLNELSDKLKKIKENAEFINYKLSKIKTVDVDFDDLKRDNVEITNLNCLYESLSKINKSITENEQKLNSLKSVDVDFEQLKRDALSLQNLRRLDSLITAQLEKEQEIAINIKDAKQKLKKSEEELAEVWKNNTQCPLCGMEKK